MRLVELRPALALCVVLASAVPAAANVSFKTTEDEFVVEGVANPQAITLADVDGDGDDDVIAVEDGDLVTVFINEQDGELDAGSSYDTEGEGTVAVATGLFNGDTFVDIVTVNSVAGTVSVLLGNEDGVFDDEDPKRAQVGANPIGVAVDDFNGDTDLDLAVLSPNLIYFLLGNGDGTFSAANPATQTTFANDSFTIAAGIVDPGNTNIDLVVTNTDLHQLAIFLGAGDGTFEFSSAPAFGTEPTGFILADVNGDQDNDLTVVDTGGLTTTELGLLLNNGSGEFPDADAFTGPPEPLAITALDVEPDNKIDLAVTSSLEDDEIFLLCQVSDECIQGNNPIEAGIWRSAVGGTIPACRGGSVSIAAGKLNGDDKDDLVALTRDSQGDLTTLCIIINQSTVGGTTMTPGASETPTGPTATPTPPPPPTFTPTPTEVPIIGVGICNTKQNNELPNGALEKPVGVTTGDFDQDGDQDVAVADVSKNQIVIVLTTLTGDRNPDSPCDALNLSTGATLNMEKPEGIVSADLDLNGTIDLAAIGAGGLSVFLGNGSGGFVAAAANPMPAGVDPSDIALADFNGDLTPDLIVADLGSESVSIFLGTRQQATPFNSRCAMPVFRQTNGAISADLNLDGRNDFAVISPQARDVGVFLRLANTPLDCGNLSASFQGQTALSLPSGSAPVGLVAATLTSGDSIPDLAVTMTKQNASGTVLLFEGRVAGSGVTYQAGADTPVPTPSPSANFAVPSAIDIGNIEDDGRQDLLITDMANNTLTEFRGQMSGGLGSPLIPVAVGGSGPDDLDVVDIDHDGRDDVVIANANDGSLSYLLSDLRANTPTPVPTNTPGPTTVPPTAVGPPTSSPTASPTPTRSRRPSATSSPAPTNTARGVVHLNGNGCAIDGRSADSGGLLMIAFPLIPLLARRRFVGLSRSSSRDRV